MFYLWQTICPSIDKTKLFMYRKYLGEFKETVLLQEGKGANIP